MIDFDKRIICASKYYNDTEIIEISKLGIKDFGENRVDQLLIKKSLLKEQDFTWHFIGHLQTNKIKEIINEIDYLHSLSSLKQAKLIDKYRNKPLKCLIQLNISEESSKNGITLDKVDEFIIELKKYDKIEIVGFMTMGVLNNNKLTNIVFNKAKQLQQKYNYLELSMGMSDDYLLAIENGTTMLRIGSYFKSIIGG